MSDLVTVGLSSGFPSGNPNEEVVAKAELQNPNEEAVAKAELQNLGRILDIRNTLEIMEKVPNGTWSGP